MSTAKGELAKYELYRAELEKCQHNIELKNNEAKYINVWKYDIFWGIILLPLFGIGLLLLIRYFSDKSKLKKVQESIRILESQLSVLKREVEKAKGDFRAVLLIPNDYCYEYALTTMIKYIDNKKADSWKECVVLYEEHLHRVTMENTAKQTLEVSQQILRQSNEQTKIVKETRDASRDSARYSRAIAKGLFPDLKE